MKVDTATLTQVIDKCFDLSMNLQLQLADRQNFLALGKRLRGSLLNLISAQFNAGTQQVINANNQIAAVNGQVAAVAQNLATIAQTVQNLAALASTLDSLLTIAASFV